MTFIAVEGVIGVGKTTLAKYLQEARQANLVLEVFEENPFLKSFYADKERYAFQTQIFFLLSRYRQMKELATMPRPIVSDYMFAKDRLFAEQTLSGDELDTYMQVYGALSETAIEPDLVVYLRADTDILMQRIAHRDRYFERNMEVDYIDNLRLAYEDFFSQYPAERVLTINNNDLHIVNNEDDRHDVLHRIHTRLEDGIRQQALPGID